MFEVAQQHQRRGRRVSGRMSLGMARAGRREGAAHEHLLATLLCHEGSYYNFRYIPYFLLQFKVYSLIPIII